MNDTDHRLPFSEAKGRFIDAIESEGWPGRVLWLTRDRLTGHRRSLWVLRPEELVGDHANREFYESVRRGNSNLELVALARLGEATLAVVRQGQGESKLLNFHLYTDPPSVRRVRSRSVWFVLRFWNRLRGESPLLLHERMANSGRR